ncbi:hypothetical protein V6X02_04150 [Spiribacter sp. 1M153]|uniref:hypothetical protein n=1 Tax=Spiribacter roseus TaxID=1855875 RepID=UPI00349F0E53
MIRTFASPRLRMIWWGRPSHSTPANLATVLRRDLALLHAATDADDLHQACGRRLQLMIDESIPFDTPDSDLDPDLDPDPDDHQDRYTLRVGYGWWLLFRFTAGEAHGVALDEAPGP